MEPVLYQAGRLNVETQGRFVQKNDGGVGHQGARDGDFLLHAARECSHGVVFPAPEVQLLQKGPRAALEAAAHLTFQAAEVHEILPRGHAPVDVAGTLQHRADL